MKLASIDQYDNNNDESGSNFYGASIVTASGEEIPITEQMLQRSFNILIDAWEKAHAEQKA